MATTNYSLPTLESTALFDLVTDYNALANATDAALARLAGLMPTETITEMQAQISALKTLTGSQGTQITTLQSQMSNANGNISTLQSGLETANGNIGSLQTGLQTANSNLSNLNTRFNSLFEFTSYQSTSISTNTGTLKGASLTVLMNSTKSLIKLIGQVAQSGNAAFKNVPRLPIPGLSGQYGFRVNGIPAIPTEEAIVWNSSGNGYAGFNNAAELYWWGGISCALGTDGNIYLAVAKSQNMTAGSSSFFMVFSNVLLTTHNSNTPPVDSGPANA